MVARDITLSGTETPTDEEAADLLFGLARAQSAIVDMHQLGEAFAALSRAFEYYAEAGNVVQAVAAAEFNIGVPTGRISGSGQLIARALTLVPADSHESGRLLSRYGGFLGLAEGDYEGAQKALGRAIAIARREGDVPLEAQTLAYATDVSGQHLHWQESVDHGLRAIDLASDDEQPYSEVLSRYWTALSLLHMGDLDAARPHPWSCETWQRDEAPSGICLPLAWYRPSPCRASRATGEQAVNIATGAWRWQPKIRNSLGSEFCWSMRRESPPKEKSTWSGSSRRCARAGPARL